MGCSMTMTDSQELPTPPRLIPALVAGFDAIANHILLIIFPLGLDLLIWLAPHLRLKSLIEALLAEMTLFSANEGPELTTMVEAGKEMWLQLAEQINLMMALRSYPVGVPSLMAASGTLETPFGIPRTIEIPTVGSAFVILVLLILFGLVIGSFFYLLVSQAALDNGLNWRQIFLDWPRASLQVLLLALIWVGLFFVVSIPASCLVSIATLAGFSFGQLSILLYGGFLVWLIFPLLFSAHGIFANRMSVGASIRSGVRMTNTTLPNTVLFVVAVIVLTQGLGLLWRVPPADSWLTLLGIAGHAFVVTGLLSASFIYYQTASYWIGSVDRQGRTPVNPDKQI
jgi:hypothetical protein